MVSKLPADRAVVLGVNAYLMVPVFESWLGEPRGVRWALFWMSHGKRAPGSPEAWRPKFRFDNEAGSLVSVFPPHDIMERPGNFSKVVGLPKVEAAAPVAWSRTKGRRPKPTPPAQAHLQVERRE
jgi:hypothetical protein